MKPSIVFDFDGTVGLGHGPVRAYARQIEQVTGEGFTERVNAELSAYDAGHSDYRDGYDIVGQLATAAGATEADLSRAYLASREQLGTEAAPLDTMPGLADFLAALREHATLILATNAPETGITALLERWGVTELFDETHYNLGKPAGLEGLVDRLIAQAPVLSIGDIAINDLIPAHERGAATALVGATFAHAPIDVTMQAPALADLTQHITEWAIAQTTQLQQHSTTIER